jgi:hypothetical protein
MSTLRLLSQVEGELILLTWAKQALARNPVESEEKSEKQGKAFKPRRA